VDGRGGGRGWEEGAKGRGEANVEVFRRRIPLQAPREHPYLVKKQR